MPIIAKRRFKRNDTTFMPGEEVTNITEKEAREDGLFEAGHLALERATVKTGDEKAAPEKAATEKKGSQQNGSQQNDSEATSEDATLSEQVTLPDDVPHRSKLVDGDVKTLEALQVASKDALLQLDGIGPASADDILAYVEDL